MCAMVGWATASGCQGQVERGEGGDDVGAGGDDVSRAGGGGTGPTTSPNLVPGPVTVRRLTGAEIRHTISDLLLAGEPLATDFQLHGGRHDFDNQYDGANVTLRFAEDLQLAAETAAQKVSQGLDTLLPCAKGIAANGEAQCLSTFLTTTGRRLYRRSLTEEERTNLRAVFESARKAESFAEAIGAVTEAMLQSPHFAFRTELGEALAAEGRVKLSGVELASALSYAVWRSAPDDELLEAAETGSLAKAGEWAKHVDRLLADAKARRGVRDFFLQWFEVEQLIRGVEKNDPGFTPSVRRAMWEESARFIETLVLEEDAPFNRLLTATKTFANQELASLYDVKGPSGTTLTPIELDGARRAGILTQPGFLAVHSSPAGFSPIFLGLFIRQKFFCQRLGQPPADIPAPSKDPNLSTREKFAAHSDSAACRGCHVLMDPIGFGFERYDSLGRYREFEMVGDKRVPLTGRGNLDETDVNGAFEGPVELAKKLTESAEVAGCMAGHLLKFMLGRDTALVENRLPIDEATIAAVTKPRAEGDLSVRSMMRALLTSTVFAQRQANSATGGKNP